MLARYYFLETPSNVLVFWGYYGGINQRGMGEIPWWQRATDAVYGAWDRMTDFFKGSGSSVGAMWNKFTGNIDQLKGWISGQGQEVCISDCGTYYVIHVDQSGIGYTEVSNPGNRLVVPSSVVPGWVSPCRDLPLPPSDRPDNSNSVNFLKAYFPWIIGGLGILIILTYLKRRK